MQEAISVSAWHPRRLRCSLNAVCFGVSEYWHQIAVFNRCWKHPQRLLSFSGRVFCSKSHSCDRLDYVPNGTPRSTYLHQASIEQSVACESVEQADHHEEKVTDQHAPGISGGLDGWPASVVTKSFLCSTNLKNEAPAFTSMSRLPLLIFPSVSPRNAAAFHPWQHDRDRHRPRFLSDSAGRVSIPNASLALVSHWLLFLDPNFDAVTSADASGWRKREVHSFPKRKFCGSLLGPLPS